VPVTRLYRSRGNLNASGEIIRRERKLSIFVPKILEWFARGEEPQVFLGFFSGLGAGT